MARSHARPLTGSRLRPGRFVVMFSAILLVSFGLLLAPNIKPGVATYSRVLVGASAGLIHWSGGSALREGAILRDPASGFAIEMKDGCNAVNVMILLWSAVLAFPACWTLKLTGLVAGTLSIQVVNLVRFISLFYLGQYNRSWFDFAHTYLWESLIVLDTMVVFWLWVQWVFRSADWQDVRG